MNTPPDSKAAALAALAAWSATSRHELVAAAWRAGNRNVTELARVAGVGRQAIYQDLERCAINPTADREETPAVSPNPTSPTSVDGTPVPGWRHPNLLWVTAQTRLDRTIYSYSIVPFAGDEPEPELPEQWRSKTDSEPSWGLYHVRQAEIGWVREAWAQARYLCLFNALYQPDHGPGRTLLNAFMRRRHPGRFSTASGYFHPVGYSGTASDTWRTYTAARDELAAAYQAMKTQPDNQWRAGLGRIVDCTKPAEDAAANWDYVAAAFVEITGWREEYCNDHYSWPGTHAAIERAAKALKLDVAGWKLAYTTEDYNRGTYSGPGDTALGEVATIIDNGQQWLKQVGKLAGDR